MGSASNQTLSGIISGTGALIKAGAGTLTLSNTNTYSGITTISAGTLKISADANLGTAPSSVTATSITFNGGTLNTTGTFTLSTNRGITLTGAGTINTDSSTTLTYGGIISGEGAFAKSGTGTLINPTGTNTYTGATTISAGTLYIVNASGLGNSSTGTTVSNGATLKIGTTGQTISEPITINGTGVSNVGAIYFVETNNSYEGAITLGSNSTITSDVGGYQRINGTINGGYTLTVTTAGNWYQNGSVGNNTAPTGYTINAGTSDVFLYSSHTVSGPITVYGIDIKITENITASGAGDINFIASKTIIKQAGTGRRTISTFSGNINMEVNGTDAINNLAYLNFNLLTFNAGSGTTTFRAPYIAAISSDISKPYIDGTGSFIFESVGDAFTMPLNTNYFVYNQTLTGLRFGKSTNTNAITVGSSITIAGDINILSPASSGSVTISSGSSGVSLTATGDNKTIVVAAGGDFINNSGSSALVASGTGSRWIVYAANDNTTANFGSLNSNNTPIWASTYSTLAPASVSSGNRYVFAESAPSISATFTTTNASKTYGDSIDLSGNYTLSVSAVAGITNVYNAISADSNASLSTVFSSNPTITSSGSATSANAGTYGIVTTAGTVRSGSGYSVTYVDGGTLTVNRKAVTASVSAADKVYNGNTTATITITYSGMVGTQTLTTASSSATFSDQNVGTEKTVTVNSITLGNGSNGGLAANYSVTTGQTTTAAITVKSLTITADSQFTFYGTVVPTGTGKTTFTASGLVNGETIGSVTLATNQTVTTNARASGITITPSAATGGTFTASNYSIFYYADAVTVGTKTLRITANAQSTTYGTVISTGTGKTSFTSSGLINSDSITSVTLATTQTATTAAGTSGITVTPSAAVGTGLSNYSITYSTGAVTVGTKALTITANAQSTTYGTPYTTGSGSTAFTSSGLINSDSITSVTLATNQTGTTAAGASSITVTPSAAVGTGLSNYSITYNTGAVTVGTKALTITANAQSTTYGTPYTTGSGSTAFTSSGLINSDSITSVTTATNQLVTTAAGASSITVTPSSAVGVGLSNYSITYNTGAVTVGTKALTITANAQSTTYGTPYTTGSGSTAFTSSGLINSNSISSVTLATTQTATTAAGTSGITVTPSAAVGVGLSNYSITYNTGAVTVGTKALTITANAQSTTYGTPYTTGSGSTAFTSSGLENSETIGSVTLATNQTATTNAAASGITITPSAATGGTFTASNYSITYNTGAVTVGTKALTITANAQSTTYGTLVSTGTGKTSFTSSGLINSDSITSVTLATNQTGTTAAGASGITVTPSSAVGVGLSNYSITYNTGAVTVGTKALTITASNQSTAYGSPITETSGYSSSYFTSSGLINSDSITSVTLATNQTGTTAVGASGITVTPSAAVGTGLSNYSITYNTGVVTVGTKALTITANAQSTTYGTVISTGTGKTAFTTSGLANSETIGSVTLATNQTAATNAAASGITITPSAATGGTFSASNYNITYATGTVTVNRAALTITASTQSTTYGTALDLGTSSFTTSGLVTGNGNNDAVSSVTLKYLASTTVPGTTTVMNLNSSISPSSAIGSGLSNYTISYITGDLIINKKSLTITADNQSTTYGTVISTGTGKTSFTSVGLVNSQTIGSVTLATTQTATTNADTSGITITPSAATGGTFSIHNYNITYATGTLTVNKKAVTASVSAADKVYNGNTAATVTITYSGLVGSETLTTSSSSATFSNKNVGTGKTVTVNSITLGDGSNGGLAANYSVTTGQTAMAAITQLSSVTWTGNAGDGLWSTTNNWAGNAIPDQSNVAAVIIPVSSSVTFDSDTVGTIGSTIANSGNLTFNGTNNFTFAQAISGGGNLIKLGSNTLTLSATNTYTGLTNILAGSLAYGINNAISSGAVTVNGSTAILALGTYTDTVGTVTLTEGSITGSGTLTSTSGFTLNPTTGVSVSVAPVLAGSVGLTKSGAGTATLSGASTYTSGTTVSLGTLVSGLSSSGAVSNGPFGTGTVTISNGAAVNIAGFSIANSFNVVGSGVVSSGVLFNSSSSTATLSGAITLSGDTLIKSNGPLTLSGSFSGSGKNLEIQNTGLLTVNTALGGTSTRLASLSISGAANLNSDVYTTGSQSYLGNLGVSTIILDSSSAGISIAGTLTGVSGSGSTLLYETINPSRKTDGTIDYTTGYGLGGGDAAALYSGTIDRITYRMELTRSGTTSYAEAVFDSWAGVTTSDLRIPDDSSTSRDLFQQRIVNNLSVSSNVTGSPYGAVTTGSGKTGFLEIWSYNYSPSVSGLQTAQPGGSGNGGTFDYDDSKGSGSNGHGSFQIHNLTDRQTVLAWNMHRNGGPAEIGFGNQPSGNPDWTFQSTYGNEVRNSQAQWKLQVFVNNTAPTLTINSGTGALNISGATSNLSNLTVNSSASNNQISGIISGTASLTKAGAGTLTLSNANTYSGTTTISAGTLSVTGTLGSGTYSANISNSGILSIGTTNQTLSGIISGTGALTKVGAGTLTLSGVNTYTGNTTVSAGTLATTHATNTLANDGSITVNSGAIYQVDGTDTVGAISGSGSIILANDKTLETVVNSPHTFSGVISGGGNLAKSGTSTLTLSGSNTFTGKTSILYRTLSISSDSNLGTAPGSFVSDQLKIGNSATLSLGDGVTLNANRGVSIASGGGSDGATITNSGSSTILSVVSGTKLTKSGTGTLILSGNNTYTGETIISAGTLAITSNNALGTNAAGTTIASGGTLDLRNITYSTTEALIVNGGTVKTSTGTSSFAGGVTLGANSTIDVTGTQLTISGVVTDGASTYGLTKTGSGILVLSNANTYDGTTTTSAGTLVITNANGLGSTVGATTVSSGAALSISNNIIVAEPITISGTGVSSGGALVFTGGNNTYSGNITLDANSTIISNAGNQTISATINGAYTLGITAGGNWTQSGIVGADIAPTSYTISAGSNDIILSANHTVAGDISILAPSSSGGVTIGTGISVTATGDNRTIVVAAGGNFINNSGSSALVASGTGSRWIVYTANDNTTSYFGSLNSNNTPIWSSTYSTLAPASVDSGNRYVFAETATQTAMFTTINETINYGDSLNLSDNYSLTTSGVAGLANVYNTTTSGAAINLSTVYSSNPTINISATGASTSTSGNTKVGSYTLAISLSGGTINSGYAAATSGIGTLTVNQKNISTLTLSASNKTYNGDRVASVTITSSDIKTNDVVTFVNSALFNSKDVGNGKTVAVSSISISGGSDSANYNLVTTSGTTTANVTAKALTISGITAANKTYNGNTTATVDASNAVYTGLVAGDSLSVSATGTFANKNVGTGKVVTLTSSYSGDDRNNYSITDQASATANITAKALTISGITAANKTYNGNTTATVDASNAVYTGLVAGDSLSVSATGTFANKNVGTGKVVTLSSSYSGDDRNNYSITDQASTTANITAKALTISGITAANKTYNGNTTATVDASNAVYTGLVAGDSLSVSATGTFANKNVGTGKTVTLTSSYSGDDRNNYSITDQGSTTANITAKVLTLSGLTADNKAYDGGTVATISSYGSLSGVVLGDIVTINSSGADPDFNNKNVGTGKTVTVQSLALAGTDAGNYSIGNQTTTANISEKAVTATVSAADKVYDGNDTATVTITYSGLVGSETLTTGSSSATFSDKNVATEKTVTC
jgi:autotransporter-associated beta strand protein